MKSPLNLAALRKGAVPNATLPRDTVDRLVERVTGSVVSRRGFIGTTGAGAVAASAVGGALARRGHGFNLVGDEKRLAFVVDGEERWVIEPRRFDGTARLRTQREAERIRIWLTGAFYPGTLLPASLFADIRYGWDGWRLSLELAVGAARLHSAFIPWLLQHDSGDQPCRLGTKLVTADGVGMTLQGDARVAFFPTWTLVAVGHDLVNVRAQGHALRSDGVSVALAGDTEHSCLKAPWKRRSIIAAQRGRYEWPVALPQSAGTWRLQSTGESFDTVTIEAGSGRDGTARHAVLFESGRAGALRFVPSPGLVGPEEEPATLSLDAPRLVLTSDRRTQDLALFAAISPTSTRAYGEGFGLALRGSERAGPLEITARDGEVGAVLASVEIPELTTAFGPDVHAVLLSDEPQLAALCWSQEEADAAPCRLGFAGTHDLLVPLRGATKLCVTRPADLLHLTFHFENLQLRVRWGRGILFAPEEGEGARLIVEFPPQHLAEAAFLETAAGPGDTKTPRPVPSRLAGSSRLAFEVPAGTEIPYTLAGLLEWSKLEPLLDVRAAPVGATSPIHPKDTPPPSSPPMVDPRPAGYTAIEAPYRMILSPTAGTAWAHAVEPQSKGGAHVELWHSRLGVRVEVRSRDNPQVLERVEVDERDPALRGVRALWSPDYLDFDKPWWCLYRPPGNLPNPCGTSGPPPPEACAPGGEPFRFSPERRHRNQIVHLSSHFGLPELVPADEPPKLYVPEAVRAQYLSLSALGATLQLAGDWEPPTVMVGAGPATKSLGVEQWRQRSVTGRDSFVQVVEKGYLLPFGHRAALLFVTDRKVVRVGGEWVAYLRTRRFVSVRKRHKTFPAFGQRNAARDLPWKSVEILTEVTPALDDPTTSKGVCIGSETVFWPQVGGTPFAFRFVATDHAGQTETCEMPMLFAPNEAARGAPGPVRDYYNRADNAAERRCDMKGQRVAYAPPTKPGDTAFPTRLMSFRADEPSAGVDPGKLYRLDQPAFYPVVESAALRVPAVEQLTGTTTGVTVRYHGTYVSSGFDDAANRGEVYLAFEEGVPLQFGGTSANGDKAGGVVTPNAQLIGLSRRIGPVGGTLEKKAGLAEARSGRDLELLYAFDRTPATDPLANVRQGKFDPRDFFGGLRGAKILGAVNLWDIIRPLAGGVLDNLGEAPQMLREVEYAAVETARETARRLVGIIDSVWTAAEKPPSESQPSNELQPVRELLRSRFGQSVAAARASAVTLTETTDPGDLPPRIMMLVRDLSRLVDELRDAAMNPGDLVADAVKAALQVTAKLLGEVLPAVNALKEFQAHVKKIVDNFLQLGLGQYEYYRARLQEFKAYQEALEENFRLLAQAVENPRAVIAQLVQAQLRAVRDLEPLAKYAAWIASLVDRATDPRLLRDLYALLVPPAKADVELIRHTVENLVLQAIGQYTEGKEQFAEQRRRLVTAGEALQSALQSLQTLCWPRDSKPNECWPANPSLTVLPGLLVGEEVQQLVTIHRAIISSFRELEGVLADPNLPTFTGLDPKHDARVQLRSNMRKWVWELTVVGKVADRQISGFLGRYVPNLPELVRNDVNLLVADLGLAATKLADEAGALDPWLGEAEKAWELWNGARDPFQLMFLVVDAATDEAKARLAELKTAHAALLEGAHEYQKKIRELNEAMQRLFRQASTTGAFPAALLQLFVGVGPLQQAFEQLAQLQRGRATLAALVKAEEAVLVEFETAWKDLVDQFGASVGEIGQRLIAELRRRLEEELAALAVPSRINLRYDWKPQVQSFPRNNPIFEVGESSSLSIGVQVTTRVLPGGGESIGTSEYQVKGLLTNFTIHLLPSARFLSLTFSELLFEARNGAKPVCRPRLTGVVLGDELGYISDLQKLLSPSEGPFVELFERGIRAGYRFGVPTTPIGPFLLTNLRLSVAVELPFTGEPARCRFAISEPARPFLLRSGIYAGGGFLSLAVGLDGVEEITGALEFGVFAEINIGVASGQGFVLAGIYFSFQRDRAKVCGFVHAGGHLDVLGLISMSLYVDVRICYVDGVVKGWAMITVSIEIGFFEIEVDIRAEYTFAGSPKKGRQSIPAAAMALLPDEDPARAEPVKCRLADRRAFADYRKHFAW